MNCKIYNVGGADSTVATIGLSDESQVIAHVPYETPDDRANAEFIVRAVNSHDALLAACQAVYNDPYTTCECAEKVRAAIAQATGN